MADNRPPEQEKVADQVEYLVAREFVGKAQGGINHLLVIDENQIVEAAAAGQAHLRELVKFADKAKGSRGGDLIDVVVGGGELEMHPLYADRPRIVEGIVDDQM